MDFFEHQDQAHRATTKLMFLFLLAIAGLIGGMYIIVMTTWNGFLWWQSDALGRAPFSWNFLLEWDAKILLGVTIGTLLLIVFGCLEKYLKFHSNGARIATALGGKRLMPGSPSETAKRLFNTVEEMALASGMPVPPVYILEEEQTINAFAAGHSPDDAVIGITRGALNTLSRRELQGVIAHEISHIVHGDIRMNLDLVILLGGIQRIGLLGFHLLRNATIGRSSRRSYSSYSGGSLQGTALMILVGGSMMVLGSLGLFFASAIKAAISRQREFLADASAVQFTRYPKGLAEALKKIGGLNRGSAIQHPNGLEVSHMFFSSGFFGGFDALLATHPPLTARIKRLDPTFQGEFTPTAPSGGIDDSLMAPLAAPLTGSFVTELTCSDMANSITPETLIEKIGEPTQNHLDYIHAMLEQTPVRLRDAAHEPFGARAVVYGLLLTDKPEQRRIQKRRLSNHADPKVYQETLALEPLIDALAPSARLPLVHIAIPSLKTLSPQQYDRFKTNVRVLIPKKDQDAVFGWTLRHSLLRHLEPGFREEKPKKVRYSSLWDVASHCEALLSTLAHRGHSDEKEVAKAFHEGARELNVPKINLRAASRCTLTVLDLALVTLDQVAPKEKRRLLQACGACVLADQQVTVQEYELLRAIADSLGCPMPPILPVQSPVAAERVEQENLVSVPSHS